VCSLFLSAGRLPAQTQALAQPARPIVQKDYDELRHEAGRAKPEEVPVLQQKAEAGDLRSQLSCCFMTPEKPCRTRVWKKTKKKACGWYSHWLIRGLLKPNMLLPTCTNVEGWDCLATTPK
jgi:hypothetical protein